jgi:hypothetical protein
MTAVTAPSLQPSSWPTTRILFALAGTMTLLSVLLVVSVSPWFLLLTAFVGANQLVFMLIGACPASLVINRLRGQTGAAPYASC